MKIWDNHVHKVDPDTFCTKLSSRVFVGLFMKFTSTTIIIVFYSAHTKRFKRTSHAYFEKLSVDMHSTTCAFNPSKHLISNYPKLPENIKLSNITSNLATLSILPHLTVTYKVYLPETDQCCPIIFQNNEEYGLSRFAMCKLHTWTHSHMPTDTSNFS